jgi:hypothetical protein
MLKKLYLNLNFTKQNYSCWGLINIRRLTGFMLESLIINVINFNCKLNIKIELLIYHYYLSNIT